MHLEAINLIYFSPTGTTKRVLEGIARGFACERTKYFDLTFRNGGGVADNIDTGLSMIGVPVYGGRVPGIDAKRITEIRGRRKPAVIVVVYGNRDYDDALIELRDISMQTGFVPVAGAAFIGEHSFSTSDRPIAPGRPDEKDMDKAADFGRKLATRFDKMDEVENPGLLKVPGNIPYKDLKLPNLAPQTVLDKCTLCGICADVCPAGAIEVGDSVVTDPDLCILCHACIRECPEQARFFPEGPIHDTARKIHANFQTRKEPDFFWDYE